MRLWLFSVLAILAYQMGVLVNLSYAEQFRDAYTWSNLTNKFFPVPHKISDDAPCLDKDFFRSDRTMAGGAISSTTTYAQCGQDHAVYKISGEKRNGFFVDLAAHDYSFISNTLSLELIANWDGLCIEPIPVYAQGILENRRCKLIQNPVFSGSNYHVSFKHNGIVGSHTDNKDLKKEERSYSFLTVTLMSILQQFKAPFVIDYLSLDIEGAELHALKHFDFGIYTFLSITVERPQKELHLLLVKHNYWFATTLRLNATSNTNTPGLEARLSLGEALYIHETNPNFKQFMIKYRVTEGKEIDTKWEDVGAPKGQIDQHDYLLDPAY